MAFPAQPPSVNVLLIAQVPLQRWTQAGPLPPVKAGDVFWCTSRQSQPLIDAGMAVAAPEGTVAPLQEPAHTVQGQLGLGAGASNSSV